MAVEVLSPQDCLKDNLRRPMNSTRNPNPNPVRISRNPADRRIRKPVWPSNNSPPVQKPAAANNLVMGQVKILKRGEAPKPPPPKQNQPPPKENQSPPKQNQPPPKQNPSPQFPDLGSTSRLGPDPTRVPILPKQTKPAEPNRASGFYAGSSSSIASPDPSSLPLPSFFSKNKGSSSTDEAASVLLKLLRLNLS